jgi:CPA2 family monovalent cation:H+ antiporter-2
MLLNPMVFVQAPLALLATVAIIVVGKAGVAWVIVRAFRRSNTTALTVAASLAQIGEFSFILIGLGIELRLVEPLAQDLLLAGAILSIMVNPLVFKLLVRRPHADPTPVAPVPARPAGHDVVIGYGRVGSLIGAALAREGGRLIVIETGEDSLERARRDGADTFIGNAADPEVLAAADLAAARRLFVTIPEPFEAGQVVEQARALNPMLDILARAHSDAAVEHLAGLGASLVVSGEREIAERMIERARGASV